MALAHVNVPQIASATLESKYRAADEWMSSLGDSAIIAEKKIRDYRTYRESYLMAFAVEAILDCSDDGLEIGPEDQALALLASKAIIDSLSA